MFRIVLIIIFSLIPIILSATESRFIVESIGTSPLIEPRKSLIRDVLRASEKRFTYNALTIILDTRQKEPRGKMQGHTITLAPGVQQDSEFVKLLVHEVSHYIDIFYLRSTLMARDPSSTFYAISWKDKSTKKSTETLANFVSGYAATSQYEDFAESLTFYIFHNEEFADRALKNSTLREKYLFISRYVFGDDTYIGTDFTLGKVPSYLWDTTKLPISLKKYLYSLY
jgi:hypothetical protein